MMIDLSKVSPEPWLHFPGDPTIYAEDGGCIAHLPSVRGDLNVMYSHEDAELIVKARRAIGIMMRREWTTDKSDVEGEGWRVMRFSDYFAFTENGQSMQSDGSMTPIPHWPDPFTALDEADKWYVENVEKRKVTENICPQCKGTGRVWADGWGGAIDTPEEGDCFTCNGTGQTKAR